MARFRATSIGHVSAIHASKSYALFNRHIRIRILHGFSIFELHSDSPFGNSDFSPDLFTV